MVSVCRRRERTSRQGRCRCGNGLSAGDTRRYCPRRSTSLSGNMSHGRQDSHTYEVSSKNSAAVFAAAGSPITGTPIRETKVVRRSCGWEPAPMHGCCCWNSATTTTTVTPKAFLDAARACCPKDREAMFSSAATREAR